MLIIGINAYHADASAAAIINGRLVAAAEEERFSRVKHTAGFPAAALRYVLAATGASARDIDFVAIARDPWARLFLKARRALTMPRLARARLGAQSYFATIGESAARALDLHGKPLEVRRVEHHTAHLASAFFVSPFDETALFSIDGLGDFASAMWGVGRGNRITSLGEVTFPDSLGLFYTALTQYLGFDKYGDEYKVMGLASYGEPEMLDEFRRIVIADDAGAMNFELAPDYFTYHRGGPQMTWDSGAPRIGRLYSDYLVARLGAARAAAEPVDRRHMAIAASHAQEDNRTAQALSRRRRRLQLCR
jgi:carbamoyltransferase